MHKLNLGCGTNFLDGWDNHDADVDISKPLPYNNESYDYILCEHCMEHVPQQEAFRFMQECKRVLKPKGRLRISVPSIESIRVLHTPEYLAFVSHFGFPATVEGACEAIIFGHGHKSIWTGSILTLLLKVAGFKSVVVHSPSHSNDPVLQNVEGHDKIIGRNFNLIETISAEASK